MRATDGLRRQLELYDLSLYRTWHTDVEHVRALTVYGLVLYLRNMHPDPKNHFKVYQGEYDLLEKAHAVFAVMHTHPRGSSYLPSANDIAGIKPGHFGVVYHVDSGTTTLYDDEGVILVKVRIRS